jgi:ATP phosphoribosyltransferase
MSTITLPSTAASAVSAAATQRSAAGPKTATLRLGLPKGRMEANVLRLLDAAGIRVEPSSRNYRPTVSLADVEAKTLKPQNIVEMLDLGRRDVGFAGRDWVEELGADLVEVLDTGLDPVKIVAAAPPEFDFARVAANGRRGRRLVVSSEYERLARAWIESRGLAADFARSYGASEVFPPEDADVVIDNSATGATLRSNGLVVLDTLLESSTRLYASRAAMADGGKRARIEDLGLVLASVLEARRRVMLEVNSPPDRLAAIVALLPSMREATVSSLYGNAGYAVKAAVPRSDLPRLVPAVKAAGGTDLVVTNPSQIVP